MTSRRPLPLKEAREMFAKLPPPWKMRGNKLIGEWQTQNFADVQKLVRATMRIAQVQDHHPDVAFGYNALRVVFHTHRPPGLSEMDFVCAAKLSKAAARIG